MTKSDLEQFNKQQQENKSAVNRIIDGIGNNKRDIYIGIGLIVAYVMYTNVQIDIPPIYFDVIQVGFISIGVVYALKDWIYKFMPQPNLNLILKIYFPEAQTIEDVKSQPKVEMGIMLLSDHKLDEYAIKGEVKSLKNIYIVEGWDTDEKVLEGSWITLVSSYVLLSKKNAVDDIRNVLAKEVFDLQSKNQSNQLENVQNQFEYGSEIAEMLRSGLDISEDEINELLNSELTESEKQEVIENSDENLSVEDVINTD